MRVDVERKAGAYFATSPDMKGLLVVRQQLDDLYQRIPGAIAEICVLGKRRCPSHLEYNFIETMGLPTVIESLR